MPRGRVRDWKGKVGYAITETGVQHLFMSSDLDGLRPEDVVDGLYVEFDAVKAGSGWQAKKVRRSADQSGPAARPVSGSRRADRGGGRSTPPPTSSGPEPVPPELLELVPLPSATRKTLGAVPVRDRHPGLQLDKFLVPVRDQEAQRHLLSQVADIPPGSALFEELRQRQADLLDAVGATSWSRTTATPLTLHLARAAALENAGICLHPIHGFVYLPGSGLKGLARAYADQVWKPAQADQQQAQALVERVFGNLPAEKDQDKHAAGAVVFHDAWPEKWPRLIVDIVNNHHAEYYQGDSPPGDWLDPVPVYFLAVPAGVSFTFALSARRPEEGDSPALVAQAREWLDGALTHRGVGAKSNAGYGCFAQPAGTPLVLASPSFASFEATLTLTTPAYLAGALQRQEDCDLRPATVRGLLRWWWRTLHSGFVTAKQLREMESLLWGDTEQGGAIQLRVERVPGPVQPIESPYKDVNPANNRTRFSRPFQQQHGIWEAPQGRTQGLAYAGYGMDEGNLPERRRRWVAQAGMSWRLTLIAQERRGLKAADLLKQGKAALWWWSYLGGVGSRSRKGFGSINDPSELKDFEGGRWLSLGREFRKEYGLPESDFNPANAGSPAIYLMRELAKELNQNPWLEVPTIWTDPWRALDEIGMAMQVFAQASPDSGHGSHSDRKRYLGLPRNLHGPRNQPMSHQDPSRHRRAEPIPALHGERHASPIFYHVAGVPCQRLTIRVAAFPTASLRPAGMDAVTGLRECTQLHRELLTVLASYLATRQNER
jgi:CRISPR-associated protein Cmr6